jgi:hypothetical protein
MSKILNAIPPQGFELVRDRIALILTTELAAQFALTANEDNNATVYIERNVPVDHSEMPIVNVSVGRADFDSQTIIDTKDTVIFRIDCYHKSKTEGSDDGDTLSNLKLQRLIGICRAILENPVYKRLDFPAPFIENRKVVSMEFSDSAKQDALSTSMGRLTFSVTIAEVTQLVLTTILGGSDTTMTLELTDKGYIYTTNV